ncbi:MAG: molybdopterin-binding protein [Pseudomonadota bacterium]|uniref:molybdopterin-binding protein n=1 Tax=Roseovarius TaxID=74030 RepID=UPI0022A82738|nr:molybdopterin-binding protein [Roseovarius sp. EGI FJ00037]MCZ0812275.1 molybdopterin-binding protein [Roseovarius sp. EGI FJ00037]
MKFGAVPVAEAEGAILAHSLRLPCGRLRKGVVLNAEHIVTLRDAGIREVSVARLEDGDIHEDEAAHALAQALCEGAGSIHCTAPFTGRVNLIADGPGVVLIDAARIDAANAVDPMITVATVAPFHQLQSGGMAATVKIIAYGVSGAALNAAAEHARGAIRFAAPVYGGASLILTEIPGGPADKGIEAVENRLKGLGMRLCETLRCAHDEAALAEAIGRASGDVVLILTASATSDPHDTAPSALIRAGGRIERFGLPVDPGNLLFLGDIGGRPVIGLPGSARSPVLHGADWVLARVACGVALDSAGMAAMGVGGLLKEIPTRPQPRQPGTSRAPREDGTN